MEYVIEFIKYGIIEHCVYVRDASCFEGTELEVRTPASCPFVSYFLLKTIKNEIKRTRIYLLLDAAAA